MVCGGTEEIFIESSSSSGLYFCYLVHQFIFKMYHIKKPYYFQSILKVTPTHLKILIVGRSKRFWTAELPHFKIPVITIPAIGNIPRNERFALSLSNFQCYLCHISEWLTHQNYTPFWVLRKCQWVFVVLARQAVPRSGFSPFKARPGPNSSASGSMYWRTLVRKQGRELKSLRFKEIKWKLSIHIKVALHTTNSQGIRMRGNGVKMLNKNSIYVIEMP